jgi:hypothetical protein
MADFVRKKLQVFVSSTYQDLKSERQAAVEAILAAGHIPAGMELFTAGDESQMEVIRQWIDESDVFLLILGARYGSLDATSGKSYTQLEYEYAISRSKPLFACVVKESIIESRAKTLGPSFIEQKHPQQLSDFRNQVLNKISKFWEDSKDIKIIVTETLSLLARREELVGWVRADSQSNLPALADEIARLSKENAQMRNQLAEAAQSGSINGLSYSELKAILQDKGVLDFFISHASALCGPKGLRVISPEDRNRAAELSRRGLAIFRESISGYHRYEITDHGRTFLNKFEIQSRATN